jgi:hypothetical protein
MLFPSSIIGRGITYFHFFSIALALALSLALSLSLSHSRIFIYFHSHRYFMDFCCFAFALVMATGAVYYRCVFDVVLVVVNTINSCTEYVYYRSKCNPPKKSGRQQNKKNHFNSFLANGISSAKRNLKMKMDVKCSTFFCFLEQP